MVGASAATADYVAAAPVGSLVREGHRVRLRSHVLANRDAFQRWYADEEIARLLRHDQRPLSASQSRGYFDSFVLPLSARGLCYAIHEGATDLLIGTTALTDFSGRRGQGRRAMFRIVIGEKAVWGRGYGTEATRLVIDEAFEVHAVDEVRLEVFRHNQRAIAAYQRVGFRQTGDHVEWVGRERQELHVIEMALARERFLAGDDDAMAAEQLAGASPSSGEGLPSAAPAPATTREARQRRRQLGARRRRERQARREAAEARRTAGRARSPAG